MKVLAAMFLGLIALASGSAVGQVIPKDDAANGIVTVVEYYNAALDHYFMTPLANEIALCDAGQPPCRGWVRTGEQFRADAAGQYLVLDNTSVFPVCRLFNDNYAGTSTHFYALQNGGCQETLDDFPDWTLETPELFDALYINPDGTCPQPRFDLVVYRLFNNGMGGAPNHRYATKYSVVQTMVAKGWVSEGDGGGGVMCIPNFGP